MSEFGNKSDVWRTRYSDARSRRWQRIMRRAYASHKRGHAFDMYSIYGQRSFKCEFCQKYAEYAHYGSLAFFCEKHAEEFSAWQGITPWWKLQSAKSG